MGGKGLTAVSQYWLKNVGKNQAKLSQKSQKGHRWARLGNTEVDCIMNNLIECQAELFQAYLNLYLYENAIVTAQRSSLDVMWL